MVEQLIVPVDGSDAAWRALDVANSLAERCDGRIDLVQVVRDPGEVDAAQRDIDRRLAERGPMTVPIDYSVEPSADGAAARLIEIAVARPGATFVVASHGRGRSASLVGSVAQQVLEATFGPMVLVGPEVANTSFDGPVIVTADGSDLSEVAVPLAVSWGIELRAATWIIEVLDPDLTLPADIADTAYVAGLARRVEGITDHDVEFDALHGRDPVRTVVDHASRLGASLIVAATHGRTGAQRLALGSVAAGFVRQAHCPVLLIRPPHLPSGSSTRHLASHSGSDE